MKRFKYLSAMVGVLACLSTPVFGQEYPNRVIEIGVAAAAGGGTDMVSRLMGKMMEKELGGSIVVVNRPGGGGAVAVNYLVSKPHDGYTWLGASEALQSAVVMGFHSALTKDWRWYMVGGAPGVISVKADSPFKNLDDFVKAARDKPGMVNVAGGPIGNVWHLKALGLADATGTKLNYIPYTGSGPAMVAALSGDGDAVISSIAEQAEYIKGGKLRPLAMVEMQSFEMADFGQIPAVGAQYPNIVKMPARQWLGFAVWADTPKAVTDKIDAAFQKIMKSEEVITVLRRNSMNLSGKYGDEAKKELTGLESTLSWKMDELGLAKVAPDKVGIAKP